MVEPAWLQVPGWPLPAGVHAYVTTRQGGASQGPFHAFNLALHVGDDARQVEANRDLLRRELAVRSGVPELDIQWLEQVHGNAIHEATLPCRNDPPPRADALYTAEAGIACAVLTADCLPVLFCSDDGREIAVAHAGWRGLLAGILEQTVGRFAASPDRVKAWLGPAIGPCHFEVGPEVRAAYLELPGADQEATAAAFLPALRGSDGEERWLMDLYHLARLRLAGLASVSGEPDCTQCHHERWYSYRAAPTTGRFATLIFKTPA